MKSIYQAALLTAILALGSCSKEAMFDDGTGNGSIGQITKPGVEVNNAETVYQSASTRASYDTSSYLLDFYKDGETTPYMSKSYNELASTIDLPSGDWTITVRSHELEAAGWECPYFTGTSEKFTVEAEKITTVESIICKFASVKVTVGFGSDLLASMSDVKVTVEAGQGSSLDFTSTETRAGYFAAVNGSTTMAVTFSGYINGNYESFTRSFTDLAAGQWRKITFGTGAELPVPDEPQGTLVVGDGSIDINIVYEDETLVQVSTDPGKEEVITDGEEEPGTKPEIVDPEDPEDPNEGGDDPVDPNPEVSNMVFSGTLLNGQSYTSTELTEYIVIVDTEEPITAFDVVIDSTSLTPDELKSIGLTDKFSLAYPGDFEEGIVGLGFPCGDGSLTNEEGEPVEAVLNATHVKVEVTEFMSLLARLGSSTSTFYLTVTTGEETKTISFTIVVE